MCNEACYEAIQILEQRNALVMGGFFVCTDNMVEGLTGLTTPFIRAAKYRLRDAGLIEWKIGKGIGKKKKQCKVTYMRLKHF